MEEEKIIDSRKGGRLRYGIGKNMFIYREIYISLRIINLYN